jgi:hypothetical protein
MDFVRAEVSCLIEGGQVVECEKPPLCVNPLSVAFKVNGDGSIKKRLVVNGFVVPYRFKMSRFQDALSLSSKGDYQSIFDISKAYHHLRLSPESYDLVGFCAPGVDGKERFYICVVAVFVLGPAGQLLGRVMKPILTYLALIGIRNMMYVDDGRVNAATNDRADRDYAITIEVFSKAGFTVAIGRGIEQLPAWLACGVPLLHKPTT